MCTRAWVKATCSLLFLIIFFWCHICACKFLPAHQLLQLCKERITNKNNLFFQFLAGFELATSESAVQCLIHWTTAENLNMPLQKLIFNCQARSQGPRIFSRWQPLFRASSKCLRPVSIMLATATPQSPARELGAVQLSTSANRKRLRYENKPRAGASSIVACLVLTEFRGMF